MHVKEFIFSKVAKCSNPFVATNMRILTLVLTLIGNNFLMGFILWKLLFGADPKSTVFQEKAKLQADNFNERKLFWRCVSSIYLICKIFRAMGSGRLWLLLRSNVYDVLNCISFKNFQITYISNFVAYLAIKWIVPNHMELEKFRH